MLVTHGEIEFLPEKVPKAEKYIHGNNFQNF